MAPRYLLPACVGLLLIGMLAVGVHLVHATAWLTPPILLISAMLGLVALGSLWATLQRRARISIALVVALFATHLGMMLSAIIGHKLVPAIEYPDVRMTAVLSTGAIITMLGLVARREWARWMGLALGAAAIGSGALNGINFWRASGAVDPLYPAWSLQMHTIEWAHAVSTCGGALIVINLIAVRPTFIVAERWRGAHAQTPLMRWLRWSMITSFMAVPMLLVYAWMQPVVPATVLSAQLLAATLTVGLVLAVRGKAIGALLLGLSGLGLLAQTFTTLCWAPDVRIGAYYLVFWLPAALCATACAVYLGGPVLRLLRQR